MNAPELVFSANAKRPLPGVNVPVAAPSWALELTVLASCWRVFALGDGNWLGLGCCAAESSATAGGGPLVAVAVVAVLLESLLAPADPDVLLLEDPHPARVSAPSTARQVAEYPFVPIVLCR